MKIKATNTSELNQAKDFWKALPLRVLDMHQAELLRNYSRFLVTGAYTTPRHFVEYWVENPARPSGSFNSYLKLLLWLKDNLAGSTLGFTQHAHDPDNYKFPLDEVQETQLCIDWVQQILKYSREHEND